MTGARLQIRRGEFPEFCRYLRSLHPPQARGRVHRVRSPTSGRAFEACAADLGNGGVVGKQRVDLDGQAAVDQLNGGAGLI
jgi:hypothetical protein